MGFSGEVERPSLDRRGVIGALGLLGAGLLTRAQAADRRGEPTSYVAYVGSYTAVQRGGHGNGINVYRVNAASGAWTHLQTVGDLVNPSYLAFDRKGVFLYAVHGDTSDVSAFKISQDGLLSLVNRQSTQGKNPVHLAVDHQQPVADRGKPRDLHTGRAAALR